MSARPKAEEIVKAIKEFTVKGTPQAAEKKHEPPIDAEFAVISSPSKPGQEEQQTLATKDGKESLWRKLLTWDWFWQYVMPSVTLLVVIVTGTLLLVSIQWQAPSVPPGTSMEKAETEKETTSLTTPPLDP